MISQPARRSVRLSRRTLRPQFCFHLQTDASRRGGRHSPRIANAFFFCFFFTTSPLKVPGKYAGDSPSNSAFLMKSPKSDFPSFSFTPRPNGTRGASTSSLVPSVRRGMFTCSIVFFFYGSLWQRCSDWRRSLACLSRAARC